PFPNPFLGMVFDPMGLAVGLAINGLMSACTGAPFEGPVLVNSMPVNNTGSEAKAYLGLPHILLPPGVMFSPMPKAPKPAIGEPPDPPGPPIAPENDAVMIFGSKTVTMSGTSAVRTADMSMSC